MELVAAQACIHERHTVVCAAFISRHYSISYRGTDRQSLVFKKTHSCSDGTQHIGNVAPTLTEWVCRTVIGTLEHAENGEGYANVVRVGKVGVLLQTAVHP